MFENLSKFSIVKERDCVGLTAPISALDDHMISGEKQ